MGSLEVIPTVDISAWIDPLRTEEDRQGVVNKMRKACTEYGFFNLIGHGILPEAQKEALDCAKQFFTLSEEEKMDVCISKSIGRSFRGYEPPGIQVHQKGLLPDTKECFVIGHEVPEDHPDCGTFSTGPNLWPQSLPEDQFRIPIMEYQALMVDLVKVLLKVLARGLPEEWNCPPDVLDSLAENDPSIPMRLLHYGPQPIKDERQFGVGDHTDFGCVTILLQEMGTEGLEVWYPPTKSWIPVPPKENSYVINIGDMVQKYTGGYYRSARHRVITFTENHRYSVPFFLNGQLKLKCTALDGSGSETIVGEHIRARLLETMGKAGEKLK